LEEHATPIFRVETYRVRKWLSNTEQAVSKVVTRVNGGGRKMKPALGQREMFGRKTTLSRPIFFSQKEI
jgi:hypothetical protein